MDEVGLSHTMQSGDTSETDFRVPLERGSVELCVLSSVPVASALGKRDPLTLDAGCAVISLGCRAQSRGPVFTGAPEGASVS